MPPTVNLQRIDSAATWQDQAACRGLDPSIFYPLDEGEVDVTRAKAVCDQCPVSAPCLELALERREKNGVWGGYTEKERRKILRQRRRSA